MAVMVLGALLFFWAVGAYQRLVALRQAILKAFAQLDSQLQRRHEQIPALIDQARRHMPQAHDTLERVLAARLQAMAACELVRARPAQAGPIKSLDQAEASLVSAVSRFMVATQALVDADEVFAATLQALIQTDQNVLFARHVFNESTRDYNLAVQRWPAGLVAALVGLGPMPVLQSGAVVDTLSSAVSE